MAGGALLGLGVQAVAALIGTGAVVAAGAVVTKNVRDFSIVAGVPAKEIGERKLKNPKYSLGRARLFQ